MRLRVADDERAAVVLQRSRDDFARRGAELGNEHDDGTGPFRLHRNQPADDAERPSGAERARTADGALRLQHGNAAADEKLKQIDGFVEIAAAVAPQIQNDRAHVRGLEFFQKFLHVFRS